MTKFILACATDAAPGQDAWQLLPSVLKTEVTPLFADGDESENPKPIGVVFKAAADDSIAETHYVIQLGALQCLMEPDFAGHRAAICRLIGVDVNGLPTDDPSQTEIIAKQSKMLYDLREEARVMDERISDVARQCDDEMNGIPADTRRLIRDALYGGDDT